MTKILHLSDFHFGTETEAVANALVRDIQLINPAIIIISGDFTQRALMRQFKAAKQFLDLLATKTVVAVPGNHDITFYNPFERFFYPFKKYKKFISPVINPRYCADNLAVLGVNTATPYKIKAGNVTDEQLQEMANFFSKQCQAKWRIVVMHHNLIPSEHHHVIAHTEKIISVLQQCNVNLILSGHTHYADVKEIGKNLNHQSMYVLTAGTAISRRIRQQENSFNLIELEADKFKVIIYNFLNGRYLPAKEQEFVF